MPDVPAGIPARAVAPDWTSPTEDNGVSAPRAELHIALLVPDRATADLLRNRVRVVRPPLWHGGKIYLHIIPEDQRRRYADMDFKILQAIVDLGWLDASDLDIGPPDQTTIGYPTGVKP